MIKGIGNDIVELSRIERSLKKGDGFKKLVYHKDEITYCESRGNSLESYAGRFAVKEAFLKAVGTGWRDGVSFNELVFLNDDLGKPYFKITGKSRKTLKDYLSCGVHVSISHTATYASAVVIIEES